MEGFCSCGGVIKAPASKLALPSKPENVRRGGVVKETSRSPAAVVVPKELECDLGTVTHCELCCGDILPLYKPPGVGNAVQGGNW